MAVNETIWGAKADWQLSSITGLSSVSAMTVDENYKIFQGNFGQPTSTYQSYGSLAKGFAADKVKLNEMIDKSMCYCALGIESPFSTIRYVNTRTMAVEATDNRTKTDFCFAVDRYTGITNTPREIRQTLNTSTSNFNDDMRSRWAPNVTLAQPSYNGYLEPIIQFSPKNFVLLIQLTAVSDLNSGSTGLSQTYTLDEYINGEHYIEYPYITHVGLRPCLGRNDIADRTSTISNAPAIMVLEPLSIGAKLHDINNTPLTNYIDYDICIGGNNNRIVFTLMGQGRYGGLQWSTNGYISKNTSTTIDYFRPIYGENFVKHDIVNSDATRWYMPYSEENIESIRKATACFGLFFTGDSDTAQTGSYTDEKMYMGILENGVGHGKYTKGIYNVRNPQFDWDSSGSSDYKPGGGGGRPDPDPNPVYPSTPGLNQLTGAGSVCYALSAGDFQQIWHDIYAKRGNSWKKLIEGLQLFGSNPLNAILAYRWYPFQIEPSQDELSIYLGKSIVSSEHKYNLVGTAFYMENGSFWYGREKNFINSKHCKSRLFLPFYGFVELPMSQVLSKELEVQFQYNMPDNLGVWIISFGDVIYDYYECSPYIDIPITGDNGAQIAAIERQQALSTALTIGSIAASVITGVAMAAPAIGNIATAAAETAAMGEGLSLGANISALATDGLIKPGIAAAGAGLAVKGAASGISNIVSSRTTAANQIGTLSTNVPNKAGAAATTFLHLPFVPYIQFYTNKDMETANITEYKKTVGIACEKWAKISDMPSDSLLAISNPTFDTSGMTQNEIAALINALNGFYK